MSDKPDSGLMLQVNFRMPAGVKDLLQKAADDAGRSLTQEVNMRLLDSFSHLHLPPDLAAQVRSAAEQSGRTMIGEIAHRLGESFTAAAPKQISDLVRLIEKMEGDRAEERGAWMDAITAMATYAGKLPQEGREALAGDFEEAMQALRRAAKHVRGEDAEPRLPKKT